MVKAMNRWLTKAYLGVTGTVRDLKEDQRGLSGVVVAVLLILIAVLAVSAIWAALGTQLQTWWGDVTGTTFSGKTLN